MKIKNIVYIFLIFSLFLNFSFSQTLCSTDDECEPLNETPIACVERWECNTDLGVCQAVQKVCPPAPDECHNSYCDTRNNSCVISEFVCDDEDGCTIDTCDPVNGCSFVRRENCTDCFDFGCITVDACFPQICYLLDGEGNPYPWVPGEDARLPRDGNPYSECREVPVNCTTDDPCIYAYCKDGECHFEDICSSENPTTTGPVTTTATIDVTISTTTSETTDNTITGQTIDNTFGNTIHNTFGHTHGHTIHNTFGHTHGHTIHNTFGHTHGNTIHHSSGPSSIHNTIHHSSIHNTIHQTITIGQTSTTGNSEDYVGPKYPNCLNCEQLNCEAMGRRCKYLKSVVKEDCWEDEGHDHKNKQNKHKHKKDFNSNHFNIIEEDGGYGGIVNNQKKYPKKLGRDDCCPYTPTCY